MPDTDSGGLAGDGSGPDVLALLADALLGRVESLISERLDGLAQPVPVGQADDRWLKVSEVAARVGACERTVPRALPSMDAHAEHRTADVGGNVGELAFRATSETPARLRNRLFPGLSLRALFRTRTGDPFLTMEVLYQLS